MRLSRLAFLVLLLAGCATQPTAVDEALKRFDQGGVEEALAALRKSMQDNEPGARAAYMRIRDLAIAQWLAQADALRQAGHYDKAGAQYALVQSYDGANVRASAGLAQIATDKRHNARIVSAEALLRAGRYREAQDELRPVLSENPQKHAARRLQRAIDDQLVKPVIVSAQLRPSTTRPISLELRDVSLRNLFDVLQRTFGVSFVLDRDVRADQRSTISLQDASFDEALRTVLLTNQLEQKVLSDNAVFVFPNNPQKLREHQELVMKGFYLANADVKQTANMIRTMIKTRDIFIDEKIGLLVIKDTPAAIRLAERLIAAQDLAEPEVMLEVEVLEVGTNHLQNLGLRFPDTLAINVQGAAGVPGTLTLREWRNRNADMVLLNFSNPMFLLNLRQQDGSTNVLANPRIRVKNRERARIHIGDRVPVITTTAAATGGFVSESVSYLDVGLKLEVEPQIFLEEEIGIKVGLEVSNIVKEVRATAGSSLTYQIGTRNAATVLRLRDGETQVLAGLISNDERRVADRVPGLSALPVVGRLFSSNSDTTSRTEIVLLITPRLLRTLARPDSAIEFAAGTETTAGAPSRPGGPAAAPPTAESPSRPEGQSGDRESAPAAAQPPGPAMLPFGGVKPVPQ
jgi:general secretion pathway protein D